MTKTVKRHINNSAQRVYEGHTGIISYHTYQDQGNSTRESVVFKKGKQRREEEHSLLLGEASTKRCVFRNFCRD